MRKDAKIKFLIRKYFGQYLTVSIGSIIAGAAINAFYVPHHMLSGGASGLAMIFYFLYQWPIGLMIAVTNLPLFLAAYRLLNTEYVVGALYGMLVFAIATDATKFLADITIVDDTMLAAIYGGVIAGIGSGITFRVGGSSGGTDIIAAIMKKYYSLSMGLVGFSINCVIMAVSAVMFGIKPAMFTLIAMFVSAQVTDKVIEGFNSRKTIFIISNKSEEIADAILAEVGRGVTFLEGEGAFTRSNKQVIFVVVNLTQMSRIKTIVHKIDRRAFMIVQDATEVLGKGFTKA